MRWFFRPMVRMGARRTTMLAAVLVCAALAAGAAFARGGARSADVPHLTWALGAPIRGLEYTHSADSGTATVVSLGCETLVKYDRIGRLRPALATTFTTPNALTCVYTIRKNVKFWDGTTLTPADVVFSLQQAASSEGRARRSPPSTPRSSRSRHRATGSSSA